MTPDQKDTLVGRTTAVLIVVLLCSGSLMTGVSAMLPEPQPVPTIKPFSQRMGCPEWREGLSRSVTIIATEDDSGMLRGIQCMRTRERGMLRKQS